MKIFSTFLIYMLIVLGVQTCTIELARAQGVQGLTYYTYRGTGPTPNTNPLVYPNALSTGVSTTINFDWGGGSVLNSGRVDQVIVKWTGYINIPTAGTYYFGGTADDGVRIIVNNQMVLNSWIESGPNFRQSNAVNLSAGVVPVEVWYYENGGGAVMQFYWYTPSQPNWQIVPAAVLATQTTYWAPPAPQYTSNITTAQQARRTQAQQRQNTVTDNSIFIEQVGNNNTISVTQQSGRNQVKGIGQQAARIEGDSNNITLRQGTQSGSLTGRNLLELSVNGHSNTVNLNQGRNSDGTNPGADSNNHYQQLNLTGSNNNITTVQKDGSNSAVGHFMENTISGTSNVINLTQQGTAGKILFGSVNGNTNTVTVNQKDQGQHYLDYALTGNGHQLNVIQEGTASHRATISLTNAGGSGNVTLNQSGVNTQVYSIQQSCVNPAGCAISIIQNQ